MSNIDKRALREAAEKALLAGDGKWSVWREGGQKYPEIFTSSGHIVATVNGAFPVARSDFIAAANPATVLALLDELEAAERRIAELEAREVVLPQRYSMLHRVDFNEPYHTEMVYKQHQVLEALHDAGVNVAAAGKGE